MQLFPQSDEHTDTVFSKPYMSFTGAVPVWDYLPKQEPTMNTMHDEENLILFNTQGVMTVHPKNAGVKLTPSHSGPFHRHPKYLISHYTAGGSYLGAVRHFLNQKKPRSSAHFVIGRKGEIVQMLSLHSIGWHAGRSEWKDPHTGEHLIGMNQHSIGLEFANYGFLKRRMTSTGIDYLTDYDTKYTGPEPINARAHGQDYWEPYTPRQIEAGLLVAQSIDNYFNGGIIDVLNHSDIAPNRKSDAGPAFPIQRFRAAIDDRASMQGLS